MDALEDPERDYMEMADMLNIPRGTAWSIVCRYQLAGGEVGRRGGGRPVKVDDDMSHCVVRLVNQYPSYTSHQLNVEMQRGLPNKPVLCDSTLHRLLITLKK